MQVGTADAARGCDRLRVEAFAIERRAARRGTEQEPAAARVGQRPRFGRRRAGSRTSSSRCRTESSAGPTFAWAVPAARNEAMAPASLIPSAEPGR